MVAGGGPAGDLYITLRVEPHAFFRRDGELYVSSRFSGTISRSNRCDRSMSMPSLSHQTDSLERLNKPLGLAKGTPLSDRMAAG